MTESEGATIRRVFQSYEIRGEMVADGIMFVLAILVMLEAFTHRKDFRLVYPTFIAIYFATAVFLGIVLILLARGYHRPWIKFLALFVQLSAIAGGIMLDVQQDIAFGPLFMMGYCMVIGLSAFRLSPALAIFAGVLATVQVLAIDFFLILPAEKGSPRFDLQAEYNPGFLFIAIVILLLMAAASALAAKNMLKALSQRLQEELRRQRTELVFGRYVSHQVATEALQDKDGRIAPKLSRAAILFCDIRGFTTFSLNKPPGEVVALIEKCWIQACEIVEEENGIVNKFLGDGMMVLFGVPVAQPDYIIRAARTGLKLCRDVNVILKPYGLDIHVGIHEGEVIAGEIGPGSRCEYTVLGEAVNLASRIEHLTRRLDRSILISEKIQKELTSEFRVVPLGPQLMDGIATPVEIFELAVS
ncbi:MAG: adenylate/guanylate cyclase domain-containing protein [Chthoniobacterales bacterium]